MNKNIYLNIIVTLAVLLLAALGVLLINAVDRVHLTGREGLRRLDAVEDALSRRRYGKALAVPHVSKKENNTQSGTLAANAEFFDPNAEFGGRIITAATADTNNMNFLINNDSTVSTFWGICHASLGERNFEHPEKFEPMLAKSWSMSPDHKVFNIKLRKGVLWHDFTDPVSGKEWRNREVTAHDFKFYLDVIKNPDVNCNAIRVYYNDIDRIEVVSDYEFKVYWNKEYFLSTSLTLGLQPLPRHLYHAYPGEFDGKKFNDDHQRNRLIVGCGPYRFLRWDKDQRVVFVRWENYFGRDLGIMPPIQYRVFEIIKHPNTRFQALRAGSVDRMGLTPEQWVQYADMPEFADGQLRKIKYLGRSYSYIGWNQKNSLFQDKRVRQALTHLVNREKILRDVYFGLGIIVTGTFFAATPYYDQSVEPYPFDIEHAKKLLSEAGWSDSDGDGILDQDGIKFEFAIMQVANHSIQQRMLPIIKEDMAKAGIRMTIQTFEWSVYVQRLEQKNFDACTLGWALSYESDPYQLWHSSQADKTHSSNHIGFSNPEADRLIEEIRRTFDVDKRIELCHEFHRLLHEEQPYTFLISADSLLAQSNRYRNVRVFASEIPGVIMWTPHAEQRKVPGL